MAALETLQADNIYRLSIRDLYYDTFAKTMGSHVTLYNVENFGNIFLNYVSEFLRLTINEVER
ncbi:MAG: hypothetical protein J6R79_01275 [Bacteroidaceae bacterium]|nr:hypothetical protein [Bacteroidaceae bacterium]